MINDSDIDVFIKGRKQGVPVYAFRAPGRYSLVNRKEVSKTTFKLVRNLQIPCSFGDRSSKCRAIWNLGLGVRYKGNSSSRVGSAIEAQILKKLPLKFLYDDWKKVSKPLPGATFRETHS